MMNIEKNMTLFRQDGAVTILISLVMLLLITMVVLTTSKTVLMEQKIASNAFRSEQSFEAAETGLQEALNFLANADESEWDVIEALAANSAFNVFDTDSSGTVDSNTGTLPDGSSYTLILGSGGDLSGDPQSIELVSTGISDDGVANRVVTRLIKFIDPLPFPLDNPLLTGAGATVMGAATVYNPEGHSTIWSGGNVNVGDNTFIADPTDSGYPDCMETPMDCDIIASSTSTLTGLDVIEQDSSLAALSEDEFFENFFGMSQSEYKNLMVTMEIDAATSDVNNDWDAATPGVNHAQNEVIWVEGDVTLNGTTESGCAEDPSVNSPYITYEPGTTVCADADRKPSILIINGDVTMNGGFQHYGILYVIGEISAVGGSRVEGSLVVSGGSGNTGAITIWYNSDMVDGAGEGNNWGGSDGGWRDF